MITSNNVKGGLEMMNCADVRENISAYADDELNASKRKLFEEHVSSCPECRKELDDMVRIIKLCRSMPLHDLPEGFRDELHEKLTAAASKKLDSAGADKPKRKWTARTFASIAAGILLIFLGGSIVRFGMLSVKLGAKSSAPAETASAAGAAESPAETAADGGAGVTMAEADDSVLIQYGQAAGEVRDTADAEIKSIEPGKFFAAPRLTEANRSCEDDERINGLGLTMAGKETISYKTSEMYVSAEDPASALDTVMTLATHNNGALYSDENDLDGGGQRYSQGSYLSKQQYDEPQAESMTQLKLVLTFTETDYGNFTAAINDTFGAANVQTGAFVIEDRTDELNMLVDQANSYDKAIRELERKDDEGSAAEIDKLKKEKEDADRRIESLRLNSDFITVDVYINKK